MRLSVRPSRWFYLLLAFFATEIGFSRSLAAQPIVGRGEGYVVQRLPLPTDVLPSSLATPDSGEVVVGSMDGSILRLVDSNRDGLPDSYQPWASSIPHWPLGMLPIGKDLLVATKSSLLRLVDRDEDGWADEWSVLCDMWDVTKDHHDWTTGIAKWSGAGGGWVVSPVTDDVRARDVKGKHFLRGKAIHIRHDGETRVIADGLRYPTGWASRHSDGAIFFTDNQGQQKTTCEINKLVVGGWYGYPSQADDEIAKTKTRVEPAVRIPYPWARSVNGLVFVRANGGFGEIDGHLILCEYNNRFLLRASLEDVDGETQGACYPFVENVIGPVSIAISPRGVLYVGSMREGAWLGEPEQGAIFRVSYQGAPRFGIREVNARADGFDVHFFKPPEKTVAENRGSYSIRSYRHVFQGSYHSPPSDESAHPVDSASLSADGRSVRVVLRRPPVAGKIFEIRITIPGADPAIAHYTMNRVPKPKP